MKYLFYFILLLLMLILSGCPRNPPKPTDDGPLNSGDKHMGSGDKNRKLHAKQYIDKVNTEYASFGSYTYVILKPSSDEKIKDKHIRFLQILADNIGVSAFNVEDEYKRYYNLFCVPLKSFNSEPICDNYNFVIRNKWMERMAIDYPYGKANKFIGDSPGPILLTLKHPIGEPEKNQRAGWGLICNLQDIDDDLLENYLNAYKWNALRSDLDDYVVYRSYLNEIRNMIVGISPITEESMKKFAIKQKLIPSEYN